MRFAPACRDDPSTLGLRVPRLPEALAALERVERPVMQSSANLSGEPDARSLQEIPESLLEGADLVLDGGELPGRPSTVVDLRDFDRSAAGTCCAKALCRATRCRRSSPRWRPRALSSRDGHEVDTGLRPRHAGHAFARAGGAGSRASR